MSKDTKNQHVVPRAYLRYFANQNKKGYYVNVIDKKNKEPFRSNIFNVASHRYFYEVEGMPDNYWEKEYNKIENKIKIVFNNIITFSNLLCDRSTVLNDVLKDELCEILISQVLRAKNAREYFDKIGKDLSFNMISEIEKKLNNVLSEEHLKVLEKYKDNDDFVHQVELERFNNKRFMLKCARYLKDKVWVIYKNTNMHNPFVSSDNPVIFYNYLNRNIGFGYNGLSRNETIIFYPLTRNLLLALYPSHLLFNGITTIANKIIYINDYSFVTKINNLQYHNCYRQVYFTFKN